MTARAQVDRKHLPVIPVEHFHQLQKTYQIRTNHHLKGGKGDRHFLTRGTRRRYANKDPGNDEFSVQGVSACVCVNARVCACACM